MIRPIIEWPDPLLAERSWPVGPGPKTDALIEDCIDTMRAAVGAGISAVQIGMPLRLFVLNVGRGPMPYLNPEWSPWRATDPVLMDEGCLSLPDPEKRVHGRPAYVNVKVPRYERINIHYMDRHGNYFSDKLRGLAAQAFQHESEHLDGKFFLDLVPETREAMRAARAAR